MRHFAGDAAEAAFGGQDGIDGATLGRGRVAAGEQVPAVVAEQLVELSPQDADRLGIENGAAVQVAQNGTRLNGRAAIRTGVPTGTSGNSCATSSG